MRKAFILFLLVLIAGVFVSCNLDELFYREESDDAAPAASDEVGDLTIYEGLAEDSKEAVEKIGEIYGMYAPDVGRFINGQELTDRFKDEDGNPTPLVFNSWLVAYKSLFGWVPQIFENAPKNAMFHNSHGYKNTSNLPKNLRYVEYCEYRYLETNEFHKAGDLCFIELRLVEDGFSTNSWYAKSLSFDPTLRYEISTFGIDILTGEHISYDYNKRTVGAAKSIKQYDDDGVLVRTTYFNEAGEITKWQTYEYNSEGNRILVNFFNASGIKTSEMHYPGTFRNNKAEKSVYFDESENITYYVTFVYNPAWEVVKQVYYYASNIMYLEKSYDTESNRVLESRYYDEEGLLTGKCDYNQAGEIIKYTGYYPSGRIEFENFYDDNEVIKSLHYSDDDGEVKNIAIDNLDEPYELEEPISFGTYDLISIYMPISFAEGIDSNNMMVEISVVDEFDNEIALDSSEYTFRYSGVAEPDVFSDETNIVKWPSPRGSLESIDVRLTNTEALSGKLKIKITEGVMLVKTTDVFTKTFHVNTSGQTNKDFIFDFETGYPVELNKDDIFWYAVSAEDYDENKSLLLVLSGLEELIEKTGVEAGPYDDTWFWPNNTNTNLDLSVALSGDGTADSDVEVYFIFAKYTDEGVANLSTVCCKDLTELAKVRVLFHVD